MKNQHADALWLFGRWIGRCVYFAKGGRGLIKIGTTYDLSSRLMSLALESRQDIELLAATPGDHQSERLTHLLFAEHLAEGREWFRDCDAIREYIAALPFDLRPVGLVRIATGEVRGYPPRLSPSARDRHGHVGAYSSACPRCRVGSRPGPGPRTPAIEAMRAESIARGTAHLNAALALASLQRAA